jgi:phage recombination protein Bet
MASRLSVDPAKLLDTLKATVFKNATNEEMLALVVVSNTYELSPLLREIYAFPAKGGGIVPVVSVDGWNRMLIRQPDFDGIEFEFEEGQEGKPFSCTATIYVKNRSKPVKITEYFDECKRNTDPWNNMPRRMLRNRTLCQASRVAFGFSGVYNDDEASTVVDITSSVVPSEPPPKLVAAPSETKVTPQQELEAIILGAGYTFEQLRKYGLESGNLANADSLPGFAEIATEDAKRLVRAKTGLLNAIKGMGEGK